jgi:hypothetical protein
MSIRLHRKYGLNPAIPVCFFCNKEKNEILLLGAACKEEAPKHTCFDKEPCDECKKFMSMGVMLVSVRKADTLADHENPYRTGRIAVVTQEAAQRWFPSIKEGRFAFVEDEAWDKLGLPTANIDNTVGG